MTRSMGSAALWAVLVFGAAMPLGGQALALSADPGLMAAQLASMNVQPWLTKAAEQMSEADYAFRPTPEVRTYGQLLAHVADVNYLFCASAASVEQPVRDVEKTKTSRGDIQQAVAASFAFCDTVYAGMTEAAARKPVKLMGTPMPALAVLLFRTHHLSLHYGNVATYMRMRGKVPPSTAAFLR